MIDYAILKNIGCLVQISPTSGNVTSLKCFTDLNQVTITSVAADRSSSILYIATKSSKVYGINIKNHTIVRELSYPRQIIQAIAYDPVAQKIIAKEINGSQYDITLTDPNTRTRKTLIRNHPIPALTTCYTSPSSLCYVTASFDLTSRQYYLPEEISPIETQQLLSVKISTNAYTVTNLTGQSGFFEFRNVQINPSTSGFFSLGTHQISSVSYQQDMYQISSSGSLTDLNLFSAATSVLSSTLLVSFSYEKSTNEWFLLTTNAGLSELNVVTLNFSTSTQPQLKLQTAQKLQISVTQNTFVQAIVSFPQTPEQVSFFDDTAGDGVSWDKKSSSDSLLGSSWDSTDVIYFSSSEEQGHTGLVVFLILLLICVIVIVIAALILLFWAWKKGKFSHVEMV